MSPLISTITYHSPTQGYGFAGGGSSGPPGESQGSPITSAAEAATWATNTGGNQLAWVRDSSLNSGQPYEVYTEYADGIAWVMAAHWYGSDTATSNSGSNRPRWQVTKNPGGGYANDWGPGTNVFNETNTPASTSSARLRPWFETVSNKARFKFSGMDAGSVIRYNLNDNQTWGNRMTDETDYFSNGSGVILGTKKGDAVGSQATGYATVGIKATDGESTGATSNDVSMIVFAENSRWSNQFTDLGGIGWKRSNVSGNWPGSASFDTSNNSGGSPTSRYGVLHENSNNGTMRNRPTARVTLLVSLFE